MSITGVRLFVAAATIAAGLAASSVLAAHDSGDGATAMTRASAATVPAESYRVTVTRKESNLYKIENQRPVTFIKTKYCYEYAYGEEAILNYTPGGGDNKLIFDKLPLTTSCQVESLLSEAR